MRWDSLRLDEPPETEAEDLFTAAGHGAAARRDGTLPLIERGAVAGRAARARRDRAAARG